MRFFDWLFYQLFLLGSWNRHRTSSRAVHLACRFFGFLAAVNGLALLLPAFKTAGNKPVISWFFVLLAAIPLVAVFYFYDCRKRSLKVLKRYHDPAVRRSNWAMTGRFLLTLILSILEVILVFLLMCLLTETLFAG